MVRFEKALAAGPQQPDEAKNWLLNPGLTGGMDPWEGRPAGHATIENQGAEGHRAVRLEHPPGLGEPLVWCQRVCGLPIRRQVAFSARVRVGAGAAQLWLRCYRADGSEIDWPHLRPFNVTQATTIGTWETLAMSFVVPAETAALEAGGAVPHPGHAWFDQFELRLLPDDEQQLRAALVEKLIQQKNLPGAAMRRAFRIVPRHRFLPNATTAEAYADDAIATRFIDHKGRRVSISSSSQPSMMAIMLNELRLRPGLRVLEIGAGTGYNAAILAEIVGARNVMTVDLDEEIVTSARAHLEATGYQEVRLACADGWDGYPPGAPYDRIIVTVGVHDLSPAWMEQLRDGGILVAPFSFRCAQFAPAFRKQKNALLSETASHSFFMDLRGKQPRCMMHHAGEDLTVTHDELDDAALALLTEILSGPAERFPAPILAPGWFDFQAFLGLAHPLAMSISDPRLRAHDIHGMAAGIADLERRQLVLVGLDNATERPNGVCVCFGGAEIGAELGRLAEVWLSLGRPGLDRLLLAAYPRAAHPTPAWLPKERWMGLVEKPNAWFRWRYRTARWRSHASTTDR